MKKINIFILFILFILLNINYSYSQLSIIYRINQGYTKEYKPKSYTLNTEINILLGAKLKYINIYGGFNTVASWYKEPNISFKYYYDSYGILETGMNINSLYINIIYGIHTDFYIKRLTFGIYYNISNSIWLGYYIRFTEYNKINTGISVQIKFE